MKQSLILISSISFFSLSALSQTELTVKKFRFQNHAAAAFERLVLEFEGASVSEIPEVKMSESNGQKEAQITVRNVQLVGAIPENLINDSYKGHSKATGPISISPDMPQNGFSIKALVKKPSHQLDAFWLSQPNRLVIDVFSPQSQRASSREALGSGRSLASVQFGKKTGQSPTQAPKRSEPTIFCFPANAVMSAEVAFQPWRGVNSVPLAVKDPASVESEMKEGIVCYPSQSRLYPNLTFSLTTNQGTPAMGAVSSSAFQPASAPVIPGLAAPVNPQVSVGGALLPPLQRENRSLASQPGQGVPTPTPGGLPPSLGASFGQGNRANPASLLPPLR